MMEQGGAQTELEDAPTEQARAAAWEETKYDADVRTASPLVVPRPAQAERLNDGSDMGAAASDSGDEGGEPREHGGQVDEEASDDWEDDPEAALREFGRHAVMDRVQEALYNQLLQSYERVSEELRDKERGIKRTKTEREAVGVELYAMQQQLARLQTSLEGTHVRFNELAEERARRELDLDAAKEAFQGRNTDAQELERRRDKGRAELNALRETLRHVERYNEEMKGEILVTRRATYKAEQAVQGLEREKGRQDLYMDGLVRQARQLQEQLAILEAHAESRATAASAADGVLRETAQEMAAVAFEKKQLLQQWRSALVGLARRDEAVSAAQSALRDAQTAARDYDVEIDGLKRELHKAEATKDALVALKDRLGGEGAFVDARLAKAEEERAAIAERFALLQRSLGQVQSDEGAVDVKAKQLTARSEAQQSAIQAVTRERVRLEDDATTRRGEQATASKAVRSLRKRAAAAVAAARAAEAEEAALLNELARIKVDTVNTEAHGGQLREMLAAQAKELDAHEALVRRYRQEVRQRNDEVEKKMLRLDRLNRRYKRLLDGRREPESGGPLEATAANLSKEIAAMEEANARERHAWLQQQTALVTTVAETETLAEHNAELRARAGILSQKRLRLLAEASAADAELKRLGAAAAAAHMDMARLNELIGRSGRQADELEDATQLLEAGFVRELRDLEGESLRIDDRIRVVKEAKAAALDELLEAERQATLWAKKTQIERETQEALDPEVGKGEVRSMEKEIHRMQVRFEGLQREREQLLREMEQAIARREQIAARSRGRAAAAAAAAATTMGGTGSAAAAAAGASQAALAKRAAVAQRKAAEAASQAARDDAAAAERRAQLEALSAELEEEGRRHAEAAARRDALRKDLSLKQYDAQRCAEVAAAKRRLARRYADVARGAATAVAAADAFKAEQALMAAEAKLAAVRDVVEGVKGKVEGLDEVLTRVANLAQDITEI